MPGETTTYKAKYAVSTDEIRTFPAEVSQPGQEKWDTVLKEHLLKTAEHGVSFTAASGELVKCTAAITVTLPAAAKDAVVGVLANSHEVKVGAGSAVIFGAGLSGSTPLTIAGDTSVALQSDGTGWYATQVDGGGKGTRGSLTVRAPSIAFEPSATRPVEVILSAICIGPSEGKIFCGGTEIYPFATAGNATLSTTFTTYPGEKWEWKSGSGSVTMSSTYRVL